MDTSTNRTNCARAHLARPHRGRTPAPTVRKLGSLLAEPALQRVSLRPLGRGGAGWRQRGVDQRERECVVAAARLRACEVQLARTHAELIAGRAPDPACLLEGAARFVDPTQIAQDLSDIAQRERGTVHITRL